MSEAVPAVKALAVASVTVGMVVLAIVRNRPARASRDKSKPAALPRSAGGLQVAKDAQEAAAAIRSEGVCIIESVLGACHLDELRARIAAVEPRKLQNRRQHRWEHVHSPEAPPLAELASTPLIVKLVRALLGPKTYLEKVGLLVSHHGAEAQRWHMDTPHLFSVGAHLPPHSLSVFLPFCDLVPANGPTEFQLGTHIRANLVAKPAHADATCPAGSLVLYDPRIMHRGGPNQSEADRPMVYLTFSRIWYASVEAPPRQ